MEVTRFVEDLNELRFLWARAIKEKPRIAIIKAYDACFGYENWAF